MSEGGGERGDKGGLNSRDRVEMVCSIYLLLVHVGLVKVVGVSLWHGI